MDVEEFKTSTLDVLSNTNGQELLFKLTILGKIEQQQITNNSVWEPHQWHYTI
jgi:hypothetical protein